MASTSALAAGSVARKSYASRVANFTNTAARQLLETMEKKKTNLSISVDVTTSEELLQVIEAVGEEVCLVKVSDQRRPSSLLRSCSPTHFLSRHTSTSFLTLRQTSYKSCKRFQRNMA